MEVNRDLALAKLRRRFHPIWFQYAHAASVAAYTCAGQWEHALREAETAITEGRSRADAAIVSFSAAFASYALLEQRDWNRAVEYAQLALREAPTIYFEGIPQLFLASYLCSTGQLADLERALAIFNRLRTRVEPERIRAELAAAAT